MEKKHIHIALLCLLFAVIIAPSAVSAQSDHTPEETAFLKSLNGKWNNLSDYSKKWGSGVLDITLKYVNGKVKISYSGRIDRLSSSDGFFGFPEVSDARYDSNRKCLNFSYETTRNDMVNDDKTHWIVHISIPYQDVDGSEIVVQLTYTETYSGLHRSEETFYYKH